MKYKLIRSDRKTLGIQVKYPDEVIVRAPLWVKQSEIDKFVSSREQWVRSSVEKLRKRHEAAESSGPVDKLTMEEIQTLADRALAYIPERVRYYAPLVGVTYGRITIRNQRSRWGSCSSNGNLNFNCLLMLMPPEVIDSVVVHELCHRLEMNHSTRFYENCVRVMPDYYKWSKWLKDNGAAIMARMA